jgi:hypothetical protein
MKSIAVELFYLKGKQKISCVIFVIVTYRNDFSCHIFLMWQVNNLVKNLVAGQEKEDPAGLHVFIPHTVLQQHNYVLNNIMFLEVTVG